MSLLLKFLSFFPLALLRWFGGLLGLCLWYANSQARLITEINLQLCFPAMPLTERKKLARRSVVESGKTAMEMAALWLWPCEKTATLIKKVSGQAYLEDALKTNKGVILLTPHLGNWEAVGIFASQQAKLTVLYAPAKIQTLNDLMIAGRTRNGYTLAPTNVNGVKALLKALKAKEVIGILPDQVPDPESGLFTSFFGQPAFTMTLVANLAARTGAAVVCCYAKRLQAEGGFEICLRPALEGIASENLQEAVLALNRSVEDCVNDCPEQYQWEYKRFKRRPNGLPKLY
jgi:KDO2-lipid IV(A) lauroyltransferase